MNVRDRATGPFALCVFFETILVEWNLLFEFENNIDWMLLHNLANSAANGDEGGTFIGIIMPAFVHQFKNIWRTFALADKWSKWCGLMCFDAFKNGWMDPGRKETYFIWWWIIAAATLVLNRCEPFASKNCRAVSYGPPRTTISSNMIANE